VLTIPDRPGYGVELIDDLEERFPFAPGPYYKTNRSSRARTCRSGGAEDVRRFSGFLPVLDHARSGGLK